MNPELKAELLQPIGDLILIERACSGYFEDEFQEANRRVEEAGGCLAVLEKLREKLEAA